VCFLLHHYYLYHLDALIYDQRQDFFPHLWSEMLDVGADCEKLDHTSRHFRVTPEMIAREAAALGNRAYQILALF
jgi:hypothetical protein